MLVGAVLEARGGGQGEQELCPPGGVDYPLPAASEQGLRHFRLYWKEEKSCLRGTWLSQSTKSEMQTCLWTIFSGFYTEH